MLTVSVAKGPLCEVVAIVQAQIGPKLVSIIWNSGMSAVEGFFNVLKSIKMMSGHSEIKKCPLYDKYLLLRGVY